MAKPTLKERLLGGFIYFVEGGLTVDSQVVSALIKPDTTPLTNWTDGSIGTVLNFSFEKEEMDSSFMAPQAAGGPYKKINRKFVSQRSLMVETREMGDLVFRLEHGLAPIVIGQAQTPGTVYDPKIEGWLRLQGRDLPGTDALIMDWWCEVRLESKHKFDEKIPTPALRFTLIDAVNGAPVTGNSVVFPTGS
jgi:hypothetical protein